MNCRNLCIVASLTFLAIITSVPQSFADSFEPPFFKWDHSPTMCTFEPSDSNFPNLGQKMFTETQDAVLDWETKLNGGNAGKSSWNINLIEIPLSEVNSFNATKCDITIHYLPKSPYDNNTFYVTGSTDVTQFPKIPIYIYYIGAQLNSPETIGMIGSAWYYEYPNVWVYTNHLLTDPQLQMTIRHEIGHSLGLAHYDVSSEELYRINNGYEDAPSIMVNEGLIAIGVNHFDITPTISKRCNQFMVSMVSQSNNLRQYNLLYPQT